MKSPFQDRLTNTSCKNCIFAIYDNNTQTECSQNRLEKFDIIEAYDLEKEFYVVKGFCNYCRPQSWNNGIADKEKAKRESSITFDIIINCCQMDENYFNQINNLLKSIAYDKTKYKVLFCHNYVSENSVKKYVSELYRNNTGSEISLYNSLDFCLNNYIKKTRKTYHIYIANNNVIRYDLLEQINNKINDDVIKLLTAESDGVNIISNYAYKSFMDSRHSKYSDVVEFLINQTKSSTLHIEL